VRNRPGSVAIPGRRTNRAPRVVGDDSAQRSSTTRRDAFEAGMPQAVRHRISHVLGSIRTRLCNLPQGIAASDHDVAVLKLNATRVLLSARCHPACLAFAALTVPTEDVKLLSLLPPQVRLSVCFFARHRQ
jgi:hypothetical protein